MERKFDFRCGNYGKKNLIYAIKSAKHPWHYFEEKDTLSSEHGSLPAVLDSMISKLNKISTIEVSLDESQWRSYYENGRFVFNNVKLKTYMQLAGEDVERTAFNTKSYKTTDQLVFVSGQTNPLIFLKEYEKCRDIKYDEDKMFKIRNFVDASHKAEFSEMYHTSDWQTVRKAFLKRYALSFIENKKRALNVDFFEELSLRSFVERKLNGFSSYTTLTFINQMEMVLCDLPIEISCLFLVNEIMTRSKTEILDFCDMVQDLALKICQKPDTQNVDHLEPQNPFNSLNIIRSDVSQSPSIIKRSDGRNESNSDDSEWETISKSSMSVDNSSKIKRGGGPGRTESVAKRERESPRKTDKKMLEENTDYDAEFSIQTSDAFSASQIFKLY
ncbi:uncharacterized protein LOC119069419 [Bradysia coprophila]|uniref:uncharacterized protein LOC119069419 n=1 Tax=Bradysia coprophila TaxID=38358 RepID=UPI00187D800E|nr:uncharacterized protein LOC119069419 [Bradysia coprophila]